MKRLLRSASITLSLFVASNALAQSSAAEAPEALPAEPAPATPPPPPPPPVTPPPAAAPPSALGAPPETQDHDGAPKARTGFQMAIRTGVQIPFGKFAETQKLDDLAGVQVPLHLELGGKPIPNLFLGGYLGLGVGGAGGALADACQQGGRSCVSASLRIGLEIQYHIAPEAKMNPWLGYGIGIASMGAGTGDSTVTAAGPEYAHFMAGLDFRLGKAIGIGPFVDFSLGRYTQATVETPRGKVEGEIDKTALHQWLTLGARLVVFP